MAPHSSTLAWKIQWTEEPGGLQSMGSLRVGFKLSAFPVFSLRWHLRPQAAGHDIGVAERGGDLPVFWSLGPPGLFGNHTPGSN